MELKETKNLLVSENDIYRFVMELIPCCDNIQTLMDRIYREYSLPMILTDISYHLIAYSGPIPCPEKYWNKIIESGVASAETIVNSYFKDGYMDIISKEKDPFVVDWGVSEEKPQTTCAVYAGGILEGICSVLHVEKNKEKLALTINAALRSAAEIYLNGRTGKYMENPAPERSLIARLILEDTKASIKLLEGSHYFKSNDVSPGYVIIALQTDNSENGRLQNLRSGIKSRWPSILYVNKDDGVYMFFHGISSSEKLKQLLKDIDTEAEGKTDYICGVSNIFYDLNLREAYVEQAALALKYGTEREKRNCVYHFSACYPDIILNYGIKNINPVSLVLPEIKKLQQADAENDTRYFESLKIYLYNKCDMSKTAAAMFLHRNSLMYRIKRCQEIMDVDLSDNDSFNRLYTCMRVLDYKGKV